MKMEHITKLDQIIDNPKLHNTEEKLNIVIRVVRDIAIQVRGHYTDINSLRTIVEKVQIIIEELDSKLFGNRDKEGVIYALATEVKDMKNSFDGLIKLLWGVLGAVVVDVVLRFFNII